MVATMRCGYEALVGHSYSRLVRGIPFVRGRLWAHLNKITRILVNSRFCGGGFDVCLVVVVRINNFSKSRNKQNPGSGGRELEN